MSEKWTPKPWSLAHFAYKDDGCECGYVLVDGYCGAVATVHASCVNASLAHGDNPPMDEAIGNAHLISASPELFEAMEAAVEALRTCYDVNDYPGDGTSTQDDALRVCRAALAKARGESQ